MPQRRIQLHHLTGKTAAASKSKVHGINSFEHVGVQLRFATAPTAGEVALKQCMNLAGEIAGDADYFGEVVNSVLPTAKFVTIPFEGVNVGTCAYVEITVELDQPIAEAWLIMDDGA